MKRLFIAVPIQSEAKNKITNGIISDVKIKQLPVKWTAYQNLHLTIQFLGDVDEKRIGDLKQIINRVKTPVRNEFLKFTGIDSFPGKTNPKIIYIGMDNSNYLRLIHRQISHDLLRNGFSPDRKPFKPHLTLGRVRENGEVSPSDLAYLADLFRQLDITDSLLDRIILFESVLRPAGPVYSSIYEKKLI